MLGSVAFRSRFVRSLLLDLDIYGRNDPDEMFPLFYKQVARNLVPKLAVIFNHLVKGGSFPACWRIADVDPETNESSSSDVEDYRPMSITSLLANVFGKIVAEIV